jgi:hypothetical protein
MLDPVRLNKQRLEVSQILAVLAGGGSWSNHAAVRMWRGHEGFLRRYGLACCDECDRRGIADDAAMRNIIAGYRGDNAEPFWLGVPVLHRSHRLNLVFKDPLYYGRFRWDVPEHIDIKPAYVWPIFAHQWAWDSGTFVLTCYQRPRRLKAGSVTVDAGTGCEIVWTRQPDKKHVAYLLEKP